jgi:hypothetical protein
MENKKITVTKYRFSRTRVFVTTTFTVLMIVIMILNLLLEVNFDFQQFNWYDLSFSMANWVVGRAVYFPIGYDIGLQYPEVTLVSNTLDKYRKIVFKNKINKEFRIKLDHYNKISKAEAYMDIVDRQLMNHKLKDKEIEKWENVKEDLQNLLDFLNSKITEYTGEINLDSIDVKYDKTTFSNMFSGGLGDPSIGEKYELDPVARGLKYTAPQFLYALFISIVNAVMVVSEYGFKLEALFFFLIKLAMFAWGCYLGFDMGRKVATEDKYQVLLNLSTLAKEIITDLEKDLKVELDTNEIQTQTN